MRQNVISDKVYYLGIEIWHRRTDCIADNPTTHLWMTKVVRNEERIHNACANIYF